MNSLSFLRHTFLRGCYSNPCTLTYTAEANGAVVGTTDEATAVLPNPSASGWINWNVKNLVQTARDSVSGVLHLVLGTAQQGYADFRSSDYTANTALRPKLYIEYTVPSAVKPNFIPFFWA